ncbi:MAG: sulfatase-like hydrolase/transferase [Acidimicrobiales bacterium]
MTPPTDIRHVLFCVADQWRYDALSAIGTPGLATPNIDALVADGVHFANHWCQASPCGPSRSSLLTGTHLPTHGQWTNSDLADHGLTTLPAAARSVGVTPLLVGYTDTPQPDGGLVDPAFDVVQPFVWQTGFPSWRRELATRGYAVDEINHPFGLYAPAGEPSSAGLSPAHYSAADSDMSLLTDAAIGVLQDIPDRALLHVNWLRPHPPMTAPAPYHRLVAPEDVALPKRATGLQELMALHPYFASTVPGRAMLEYTQRSQTIEQVSEWDERLARAAYYGLCAEVDHHLGRLIDELKKQQIFDKTLIILTSDHGESLGDHWMYGRRGPFDGHFRVPCIVRDPRQIADRTRGSTVDNFTANIDLLPTICEAVGSPIPEEVEGQSLLAHTDGTPPASWRDHVRYDMSWHDHLPTESRTSSSAADHRFSVIRTDRHRYVRFPSLPPLLFDLHDDPAETIDRSQDPTLRSTIAEFDSLLRR